MMSSGQIAARQLRSTIPEGIVREIEEQIASGSLKKDDWLPSVDALARQFGVSRASVREALQKLSARGVVEIQHGRGTRVRADANSPDGYTTWINEQRYALQELCELRLAVETTTARLAAVKATNAEVRGIGQAVAGMRGATGLAEVVEHDIAFHRGITHAAHNRLLVQAMALMDEFLTEARFRMHALPGEVERSIAAHERIFAAIEAHEPDEAARAMREHLRAVEQDLGIRLP